MRITASARKHGIADDAMLHAVRMAVKRLREDDGVDVFLGADQAGTMLEVGVVDFDGDDPRVIHAMRMRGKYERYL